MRRERTNNGLEREPTSLVLIVNRGNFRHFGTLCGRQSPTSPFTIHVTDYKIVFNVHKIHTRYSGTIYFFFTSRLLVFSHDMHQACKRQMCA